MKLEELARLAGVSKATANIILSGKASQYKIGQETCNKVMNLVDKYHYTSERQNTSSDKTHLIALIIPSLTHHGYAQLAHEMEAIGREEGYQWLLFCTQDDPETEKRILRSLPSMNVKAVMTVSSLWDDKLYQSVEKQGIKVIPVDRALPKSDLPAIVHNEQQTAQALCQLLLEQKPQDETLTYFGGLSAMKSSENRLAGIHSAFADQGGSKHVEIEHRDYSVKSGYQLASEYVDKHDVLPKHLFTGSFSLMEGVLQFVRAHPETLPDTLNWATFGDSYLLDLLPFTIHSCRQDYRATAEEFFQLIKEKHPEPSVLLHSIVRREPPSSG